MEPIPPPVSGPGDPTAPPVPVADSSRRWEWRRGLRWFGAEFLVVVSGVLVALALNAGWAGRQDRSTERAYLQQLSADLRETERSIARVDSVSRPIEVASASLVRAFFEQDRPPSDSLAAWMIAISYYEEPPQPVIGTAVALLSSGDINLVRDDSLRSSITTYVEEARYSTSVQELLVALFWENSRLRSRYGTFEELMVRLVSRTTLDSLAHADPTFPVPADHQPPAFTDLDGLLNDREALETLAEANTISSNMMVYRRMLREKTEALRQRVDAALEM